MEASQTTLRATAVDNKQRKTQLKSASIKRTAV